MFHIVPKSIAILIPVIVDLTGRVPKIGALQGRRALMTIHLFVQDFGLKNGQTRSTISDPSLSHKEQVPADGEDGKGLTLSLLA